jgi:hypothetical protein
MTDNDEHWYPAHIREIDGPECLELLQSQQVGRIVFTDDTGPDAMPVNYTMDGADVLIRTSPYSAMARAATGHRVAFEIDQIDEYTESGWSVVVRGTAHRQSPFDPASTTPTPWADGSRHYLLRLHPDSMTGRRLIPS